MSWLSGSCYLPAEGVGAAFISSDAYPEPVRVDDEVREDERQRVVLDESVGFPPVERGLYE